MRDDSDVRFTVLVKAITNNVEWLQSILLLSCTMSGDCVYNNYVCSNLSNAIEVRNVSITKNLLERKETNTRTMK